MQFYLDLNSGSGSKPSKKTLLSNNIDIPWVEKYRPSKIEDIVLDPLVHDKIKEIITSGNMPNIIITGSPGTGKTSTVLCIAKYLLGKHYKDGVIELNASDNRGLEIIKNSIIPFCKKKMDIPVDSNNDNVLYKVPKIVILDEADNITRKAQNALSCLIEEYDKNTRFALTCNDISKIIESIQSRCIILRYNRMTNENIMKRIKHICAKENIDYTEEGLDVITFIAQGDIRQAINILESTFNGYQLVNKENVYKICDQPQPIVIIGIINLCLSRNLKEAISEIINLKRAGYCSNDILLTMLHILKIMPIDEEIRMQYYRLVSDTYIIVNNGVDTNLQLYSCLSKMCFI